MAGGDATDVALAANEACLLATSTSGSGPVSDGILTGERA
jgi:hypothetical protein